MNNIFSPASLTEALRKTLEARFPFVWVKGEVSNFTRAASGHMYFILKDAKAQLRCVWFAGKQPDGRQGFDPLTGEVFDSPRPAASEILSNGLEVLCAGAINIYAPRGEYQLNVEFAQPAGAGLLAMEFEARKARLAAAGYFDQERKRPLPPNPAKIALVASPAGAAIHDFLKIAASRGLGSVIRLYPAPAQGADAAELMSRAIAAINEQKWADVIVLIRGGGSLEDLWAFNEENLAAAIFQSDLPVLAGIGHEIDFTLSDMTADMRAATPTHAAQLLWPLRDELWQRLDDLHFSLNRAMTGVMRGKDDIFASMRQALEWRSPFHRLRQLEERLRNAASNCGGAAKRLCEAKRSSWLNLDGIFAVSPFLNTLDARLQRAGWLAGQFDRNLQLFLDRKGDALEFCAQSLRALDPSAPLQRGYALLSQNGKIVRTLASLKCGAKFSVLDQNGMIEAKAESVYIQNHDGVDSLASLAPPVGKSG